MCRLSSWKQKEAVVRKARKEKPEGLFICEDLSQMTLEMLLLFDSLMEELPFSHLNEEDFRLAMFEQLNGSIRYDPDRLAGLKFIPLLRSY